MSGARGRRLLRALGAIAGAAVLSLLVCEAVLRVVAHTDDTGQVWIGDLRLLPYRLPLAQIAATLDLLVRGETFLGYDADLGWAPRPHAQSKSGPFRVNGAGIRADHETALDAAPGVLRIALFGDSFTFGDEVAVDQTWAAFLERALAARGVRSEVLNFGVNAYGMDQAYLRWRRDGRRHHPDVVIYGFQPENALRNLNVFRPLYFAGTEVPLAKPRLVLRDGVLATLDVPTIPPGEMPALLAAMPSHPLFAYERYYAPWYAPHWWLASRTAALVATLATPPGEALLRLDDEALTLANAVADAFAADVVASGAGFLIVHLPRKEDMLARRAGHELWYEGLRRALGKRHAVVDGVAGVDRIDDALFEPHGHYAPELNRIVGEALVEPVLGSRHHM